MRQNPLGIGIWISNPRTCAAMGAARVLSRLARNTLALRCATQAARTNDRWAEPWVAQAALHAAAGRSDSLFCYELGV